ncbi:MAG: CoA transferase [Dehalococcoidia bacterium]|nr:CoA transferase [Dehalococcoidia bacterium]
MRHPGQPLAGLKVVEYGPAVSTAFAGWLLAELGATVVSVPTPPSLRQGLDELPAAVAAFVRRTQARKSEAASDEVRGEANGNAVVLSAFAANAVRQDLGDGWSTLIVESATRPEWELFESIEDDMRLWARSGLASLSRSSSATGGHGQVSFPANFQASLLAGEVAAFGAVAIALAQRDGPRPLALAFDKLELLATLPMQPVATAQIEGRIVGETDAGAYPGGVMQALDGQVYVRPVEPAHWKRLLELVGDMEWASLEALSDRRFLLEARDLIDGPLRDWAAKRTVENIVEAAQARHVPLAPLNRPGDVARDRHLIAREFFGTHRAPKPLSVPWTVAHHPPEPLRSANGHHHPAGSLPLSGVRVLDLTWAWAGPFATTLLADLGADVINVEWDPRASNMRTQPPFAGGDETSSDTSGWWSSNQRGKLSLGVNLKSPEGKRIIHELAAVSDAAIENFSPGVVDRLGIGGADLRDVNGSLAYVSMSAYGKSGPNSHFVGYGPHLFASAGCAYAFGADDTPTQMLIPYADPVSGVAGAFALLVYVFGARNGGGGAAVDVSDLEATTLIISDLLFALAEDGAAQNPVPEPLVVHSRDGCSIVVLIAGAAGRSDAANALRAADDSNGCLVEAAWWKPSEEIGRALDAAKVPWAVVQNCREVLADPSLVRAEFWQPDRSPRLAEGGVSIAAPFWRVNGQRPSVRCGAPPLFSDTTSVLEDVLRYEAEQVAALAGLGVIKVPGGVALREEAAIAGHR